MRDSGEPGIAFYEAVNNANANDHAYDLTTCNPCGEQFLPAGPGKDGRTYMGNCNLSSMHAAHEEFWSPDGTFNMQAMRAVARIQQRFMDNVTDVSWYPIPAQNMTARMERRNGGGFAGIAEYLSRLGSYVRQRRSARSDGASVPRIHKGIYRNIRRIGQRTRRLPTLGRQQIPEEKPARSQFLHDQQCPNRHIGAGSAKQAGASIRTTASFSPAKCARVSSISLLRASKKP